MAEVDSDKSADIELGVSATVKNEASTADEGCDAAPLEMLHTAVINCDGQLPQIGLFLPGFADRRMEEAFQALQTERRCFVCGVGTAMFAAFIWVPAPPLSSCFTCTCCYDQNKGTQDKDFSYSFSDSLSSCFLSCCASCPLHVQRLRDVEAGRLRDTETLKHSAPLAVHPTEPVCLSGGSDSRLQPYAGVQAPRGRGRGEIGH